MASIDDIVTVGNSFNKNLSQLIVALNNFADLYNAVIAVANGGTGNSSLTANSVLTGNGTSPIVAEANFVCTDTGDVGIGNSSPSNKLSVTGNANITGNLGIGTASPSNKLTVSGNADITGNLGIGTASPDAALTVNTIASFGDGAVTTPSIAHKGDLNTGLWFPSADIIAISTAGSERVRIDSSGLLTANNSISGAVTKDTAKNSTSGTTVDFTGIPSWVKKITVIFNGVSTTSGSDFLVQIGDSGGIENSGYASGSVSVQGNTGTIGGSTSTSGFALRNASAGNTVNGHLFLTNISGNLWISSHVAMLTTNVSITGSGIKTLSSVLDRLTVISSGGGTFNAGSINIMYEG